MKEAKLLTILRLLDQASDPIRLTEINEQMNHRVTHAQLAALVRDKLVLVSGTLHVESDRRNYRYRLSFEGKQKLAELKKPKTEP